MSESSRRVNAFFSSALKSQVDKIKSEILLSDRQIKIFDMFYIQRHDINFIADSIYLSADSVKKELRRIRKKLIPFL